MRPLAFISFQRAERQCRPCQQQVYVIIGNDSRVFCREYYSARTTFRSRSGQLLLVQDYNADRRRAQAGIDHVRLEREISHLEVAVPFL